jgi:quinol monooxygenase YgiN
MIIVSGWLRVAAANRTTYLQTCRDVILAARAADGCVDFHLSADPLDDERINVFEQWESVDAVERFRGSGPSDDQQAMIIGAQVDQHEIANTISLT